ncbi:hypothetical protein GCM10010182_16720 [Actinomadura cremea]|nr:hypothetical protein GCM10010182_16720 [Actinomadura cremea]
MIAPHLDDVQRYTERSRGVEKVVELLAHDLGTADLAEENALVDQEAATSGRGLLLMSEMVRAWGVRELNEGGKITWAKLLPE